MRSVVMKDSTFQQCGICKESNPWIEEMNEEGIKFIYCHKCNTVTFKEDIDYIIKNKIENIINKQYNKKRENKKHD